MFSQTDFKDHQRGTATSLVLSGYGLSAFFFSSVSHLLFPGNTSAFLTLLAVGTSIPMAIGAIFVRPIPMQESGFQAAAFTASEYQSISQQAEDEDGYSILPPTPSAKVSYRLDHTSRHDGATDDLTRPSSSASVIPDTRLPTAIGHNPLKRSLLHDTDVHERRSYSLEPDDDQILQVQRIAMRSDERDHRVLDSSSEAPRSADQHTEVTGLDLYQHMDFWIIFVILLLRRSSSLS